LEAQVAAVWGQPGEDLVDDVAVARPDLADANETPGRGGVKLGIVANPGAAGDAAFRRFPRSFTSAPKCGCSFVSSCGCPKPSSCP